MGATSFEMENMRAMADPSLRVRFSLSFAGQMMLSGDEVKEYCAAAANAILSYEDTRNAPYERRCCGGEEKAGRDHGKCV